MQDLCIVGGGIIGCATAFYAARAGLKVVLCEARDLASGVSGTNPGTVSLATKTPGDHVRLAQASMKEMAWLDGLLGHSFDYVQAGSLVVVEDEAERAFAVEHAAGLRRSGVDIELVDAAAAAKVQPILTGPILGALWTPQDLLVNSRKLTLALGQGAQAAGAEIRENTAVEALARRGDHWEIATAGGAIQSKWLVNAAGMGAPSLGRLVGAQHAIRPRKGQLLAATPIAGTAPVRVSSVQELLKKQGLPVAQYPGPAVALGLTPQADGMIFLGGTQEDSDLLLLDPCTVATIALRLARLFPPLGQAGIVRAWAGVRPSGPHGHPLVGPVDGIPDYLIAGGHGGDGVALAPVTGRYLAELAAGALAGESFAAFAGRLADSP